MDKQILPCSNHQSRWMVDSRFYDLSHFNLHFVVKLEGELDEERFINTVNNVLGNYDLSRTAFQSKEDTCQRIVYDESHFQVERLQFDNWRDLEKFTLSKALQSFDFTKPPLIYSAFVMIGSDYYWLLIMHHIVSDVSSGFIITQQVHKQYLGLPSYPYYPYDDYVQYEEARFKKIGGKSIDYISNHIQYHAPLAFSNEPMDAKNSRTLVLTFDEEVTRKLHHLSDKYKYSFHTLFSLPLYLTHFKLTNQSRSFMAIPVSERRNAALKETPGFISGPMLIGLEMNDSDTIYNLIEKTQKHFMNGLRYYLPLGRYRHLVNCNYRVMFNVFDYRAWEREDSELNMVHQLMVAPNTMQLELFWVVFTYRDKIEMVIHYDGACLGSADMHDVANSYRYYLLTLLDESNLPLTLGAIDVG